MNKLCQTVLIGACVCGLASAVQAQDFSGKDSSASRLRADSLRATMAPDTGLDKKLAAAQAAWDRNSPQSSAAGSPVSGNSLIGLLLQVFTSLFVLLAAAFALIFLVKRAQRKKDDGSGTSAGMIDLLETKSVGPSRQIAMVRLHNRVVAIAFAGPSATFLSEFTGNDAAEIIAESGNGKTSIREFAATLDNLMDKFRTPPAQKNQPEEPRP